MNKLILPILLIVGVLLVSGCTQSVDTQQTSDSGSTDTQPKNIPKDDSKVVLQGDLFLKIGDSNVGFAGYMGGSSNVILENGTIVLTKIEKSLKRYSCEAVLSEEEISQLKKDIISTGYFDHEFEVIGGAFDVPISSYNISIGSTSKYLAGPLDFEFGKKDMQILNDVDTLVVDIFRKKGCELPAVPPKKNLTGDLTFELEIQDNAPKKLTLGNNRTLTLTGEAIEVNLSKEEIDSLKKFIVENGFFSLEEKYEDRSLMDAIGHNLTVTIGDTSKSVYCYGSCPDEFSKILIKIKSL